MHCASCALLIKRSLIKTNGVTKAEVNYGSEEAIIDIPSPTYLPVVEQTIKSLGYTPILEQDPHVSEEEKEHAHIEDLKKLAKKVTVSAIASGLVLLLTLPDMLGFFVPQTLKELFIYMSAILATIVQFYGGLGFYQGALSAIKTGATNMDTLIVLGTTVAYGYSIFHLTATILGKAAGLPEAMFFDSSTVIITLVLLGKYLESKGKHSATAALRAITKLESTTVHKVIGNDTITIPTEELLIGDILEIRPGERVPVDGVVTHGQSPVDEAMITGEPIPIEKTLHDELIAGTVNTTGVLQMKATAIGKDTLLSHIQKLVRDAQNAKPDIARLADSISSIFVPIVILLGIGTAVFWFSIGLPIDAIAYSIAVFVVACPCALGLATPMAIIAGVGRAASGGVLIRSSRALEKAGNTNVVVFDKTGTITMGKPDVTDVVILDESGLSNILAVEKASEHPLAGAILSWAKKSNKQAKGIPTNIQAVPGRGIIGTIKNKQILIGTQSYLEDQHVTIKTKEQQIIKRLTDNGKTLVFGAINTTLVTLFAIDDQIRPEAKHTISLLRYMHIHSVMLSGDKKDAAIKKAKLVGIEKVIAEVRPDQKATAIEKLRSKTTTIMMIGDGINDAPALAAADVGIAIGSGTAIAKATADMTILANNLNRIPFMIQLSTNVMKTIKQNLVWAFGYNIILIPIAMGIGSRYGVILTPPMAAFAMATSSLSVVLNSIRLTRMKMEEAMA